MAERGCSGPWLAGSPGAERLADQFLPFIALDREGRTGGAGTSGGFSYCVTTAGGSRLVEAEVVTS